MKIKIVIPGSIILSLIIVTLIFYGYSPPSGMYAGYTAPVSPPVFFTCQNTYQNALLPDNAIDMINGKIESCQNGISGYHFAIQYNRDNGRKKIPATHAVVQMVLHNYLIRNPCNGNWVPLCVLKVEYFRTLPNGLADIDNQIMVTCCNSEVKPIPKRHSSMLVACIIPKDPNWPPVPANGAAGVIAFKNLQLQLKFISNTIMPNRSVRMFWDYYYDNCPPINLPACAGNNHHVMDFYSETLDPPNKVPTWSFGIKRFCSN
ncbi:MAG: hypothetical protein WCE54_19455 [Ignavibacteriaceae bacterium]